jgi:flagellar basal body rod protein FlgG
MSNEELERRMAFIVEQQAQFTSDIQQLREVQGRTENVVGRLANATLEGFKDTNAKIDALVDSQIKLTEAQTQTDQTLRNLIAVADRYFREGRNGK